MNGPGDLTPEELDDICLSPQRIWTFAKTMPEHPHWYLVRSAANFELFRRFVMHIRKYGRIDYWCWSHGSTDGNVCKCRKKTNLKFNYRGCDYWTMEPSDLTTEDAVLPITTVINRCVER